MANKKISQLLALGAAPATTDVLPMVDVSGTATTKKVTVANLLAATNASAAITGGSIAGITDLAIADGGTGASSASDARTNLGLGSAATLNVGTAATNVVQLADVSGTVKLPAVDGSQLTGISSSVDGTAVTSTGETGATKFLREDGDGTCSFQNVVVGDAELRGTANPHIGVFPNQSFLVTDNPANSVMVIADASGNLEFLVNSDSAKLFLNKPSLREEITTGVSVKEDSAEPDIEITTSAGTFSLVSGDSDVLGANGLPARQGFNIPDIGANQAPLLISGGTIA